MLNTGDSQEIRTGEMHKKAKAGEWTGRGTGPMMEGSHPFFKCSYNCSSCFDPLLFVTWHDLLLGPYSLHPSTRPHTTGHIRRVAGTARGARRHHPGPHARQGLDRGAESGEFAASSSHSITNLLQPSAFCPLSPVCALLRNMHFLLSLAGPDAPER